MESRRTSSLNQQRSGDSSREDGVMTQMWCACVDEVPSLTIVPHEICEPVSSEEVVKMWEALKDEHGKLKAKVEELEWILAGLSK
jgi:hypothetical protein